MPAGPTERDHGGGFLDSASGLPPSPAAPDALAAAWRGAWADPQRRYSGGRAARRMLDTARRAVAHAWGAPVDGLFFAPDRATAVWWALTGHLTTAPRLIVTAMEDLPILRCADLLASRGVPVTSIGVGPDGAVDRADLVAAAADGPATVVVQAANIEVGSRQDLAAVRAALPATGHVLVSDVQAVAGREPLPRDWDIAIADAVMWGGPPGVAVCAVRAPARFRPDVPVTEGQGQIESATPAVPQIAAAALAAESPHPGWAATGSVSDHLRARVLAEIPDAAVLGRPDLPWLTMFSLLYVAADELIDELARRGWAVASGASCTSDTRRPHHVLVALGAMTHGSLRVSLTPETTRAQIDRFVGDLAELVRRLRADAGATDL